MKRKLFSLLIVTLAGAAMVGFSLAARADTATLSIKQQYDDNPFWADLNNKVTIFPLSGVMYSVWHDFTLNITWGGIEQNPVYYPVNQQFYGIYTYTIQNLVLGLSGNYDIYVIDNGHTEWWGPPRHSTLWTLESNHLQVNVP